MQQRTSAHRDQIIPLRLPATTVAEVESNFSKLSGLDRVWRAGTPMTREAYSKQFLRRFWSKVDTAPGQGPQGQCWEFKGCRPGRGGYGLMGYRWENGSRAPIRTHVAAWSIVYGHGPVQKGWHVCHRCNNPPCVREEHLFAGIPAQNVHHAQLTGLIPIAAPKPEPFDWVLCISKQQAELLRSTRKVRGVSLVDLAHMAQMDKSHLSMIERGIRPGCGFQRLQFILRFLQISDVDFGLSSCVATTLFRSRRKRTPKYLSQAPASVYRHNREALPYAAHLRIVAPEWLTSLPLPRIDLYDAHSLRHALLDINALQKDVRRATGLSRPDLLAILRGDEVSDTALLAMLRYVESLKQSAA